MAGRHRRGGFCGQLIELRGGDSLVHASGYLLSHEHLRSGTNLGQLIGALAPKGRARLKVVAQPAAPPLGGQGPTAGLPRRPATGRGAGHQPAAHRVAEVRVQAVA